MLCVNFGRHGPLCPLIRWNSHFSKHFPNVFMFIRFISGIEILDIIWRLESQHLSHPCRYGCHSNKCKCWSRRLNLTLNWADFHMAYLAGAVVECVIVVGASFPVLDLNEAGAFGGASILKWLSGWGPSLSWGLERAHRKGHTSHSFMPLNNG